jgi:GNAT superfamily N-acetyltransferase
MNSNDLIVRGMAREELEVLVEWAALEGWNPGLDDADVFWETDPDGFVAAEVGGELVGGGSIVSYEGRYGFMGFFIMRADFRGRGLGNRLWNERKRRLLARLEDGAAIGMDGVFDMQDYYARGGFEFVCRDLRFEGRGVSSSAAVEVVDLRTLRPLDMEPVIESFKKTNRAVVVEEGWKSYGVGSEIVSRIYEQAFDYVDAPIIRVAQKEVPLPYNRELEQSALPQVPDVVAAAKEVLK